MLETFANYLVQLIYQFGFFGIVIAMTIESTFIPLPSELILIPAGYLWYKGLMDPFSIIVASIIGSIIGSYFSYWLGEKLGRPFIKKHKKYFLLTDEKLGKIELFFNKYGAVSIFFARLILGVRHYISFPAGFAKMNKWKFILYTCLGAGLWSIFLMSLGYFLGTQVELVKTYISYVTIVVIAIIILVFVIIKVRNKKSKKKQ
jgi:membrane protein DedA with SNARE-associated domain